MDWRAMMEKKLAKPKMKPSPDLQNDNRPGTVRSVPDWAALSAADRKDIQDKTIAALKTMGVDGATIWWNEPGELPHWQLIVQSPWCEAHSRTQASTIRNRALAAANLKAPGSGIILKGHKKEWR